MEDINSAFKKPAVSEGCDKCSIMGWKNGVDFIPGTGGGWTWLGAPSFHHEVGCQGVRPSGGPRHVEEAVPPRGSPNSCRRIQKMVVEGGSPLNYRGGGVGDFPSREDSTDTGSVTYEFLCSITLHMQIISGSFTPVRPWFFVCKMKTTTLAWLHKELWGFNKKYKRATSTGKSNSYEREVWYRTCQDSTPDNSAM